MVLSFCKLIMQICMLSMQIRWFVCLSSVHSFRPLADWCYVAAQHSSAYSIEQLQHCWPTWITSVHDVSLPYLHLATSDMWCWSEGRGILKKKTVSVLQYFVYYYNGAQRHEQFLLSKLDYCNSLYHNLPNHQLHRLQQIQNSLARAVVKAPKSTHITPILKSLHWLKL